MIEAFALHLLLAEPTFIEARHRYRVYKRVPRPKPPPGVVTMIPVRIDNPTFEQEWQYRVCIGTLAPNIDTCSW